MKRIKKILGGILALSLVFELVPVQMAGATEMPDAKLQKLVSNSLSNARISLGYPVNQNIALNEFYKWYVNSGLDTVAMNNAGNPFSSHRPLNLNTLELEREVIEFFAPLYGFDVKEVWGIVTMSGTDGNNHGIYFGYKLLKRQTGLEPILYVSRESHYSNKRLADMQNIEVRLIDCDKMGRMLPAAFRQALDPARPALVVYSMGTTFKGAMDDQNAINAILDEHPVAVYRHVDAALFGGYLPFTAHKDLVSKTKLRFDSIAISGHKFFGMNEPSGLFLTTKETLARQTPFNIAYLNGNMPMINCSRSALNPLKFYWIINTVGVSGFTAQAETILSASDKFKERLDKIGWPAWKGDYSNTVFFKRPSQRIMEKYNLAAEHDARFGGDLAHVVVMQHVDAKVMDTFIKDILADKEK